jgi:serine/threonine protein kinase/Tol biopolymer transport system component
MEVASGTRLGPYEIVSRIGVGGMGEVWRANDTRLDRSVAIKVLPPELAQNAQLKVRFEREARAISALNHPHICTLYDVGFEGGTSYLVMELLDGESLADRLSRGPLPISEVIRYGSQVADALERAHRAGIIHRDLKPGNVMITKGGAKLLDFGLAKSATIEVNPEGATQHKPLTQEGTILGTFQYMAPEQLEGIEADARTDIFALGAVLYEMTTGKRAFEGKTRTSLIAAIVTGQPPAIALVQPMASSALEHVVSKCLEKNPDDRWQSAHDVGEELRWTGSGMEAAAALRPARSRWVWPLIALLAVLAIGSTALYLRERSKPVTPLSFAILPPRGYTIDNPAISPDGSAVAFSAHDEARESSVWIRHTGSVEATRLTEKGAVTQPFDLFWSPDGRYVGFFDQGKLMKISAEGGRPELISGGASYGAGAAWSRSGTILFCPRFNEGLFRVPASGGGDPVRVTTLDARRRDTLQGWPQFLDDGDHYLFLLHTVAEAKNEIHAGALSGGPSKMPSKLVVKADSLVGVWKGRLVFVRDGAIYAQEFDEKKLAVTGEPRKIIDDVLYSESNAHAFASISSNGAIVYLPSSIALIHMEVGWYDRSGRLVEKLFDGVTVGSLRLSADESRVVMTKFDPRKGANDLYTRDLARGVETRLTGGLSNHQNAIWSPAGDRLFFSSDRDGMYDVYAQADDGVTPPQVVMKGGDDKFPSGISPDGTRLIVAEDFAKTKNDLWLVPLTPGGTSRPLIATNGGDAGGTFSRDGKWILYVSDVSGRDEVYVRPFPDGRSVQVSTNGGSGGEWSWDNSQVFFTSRDRWVTSAPIALSGTTAAPGKPVPLFPIPRTMSWWSAGVRADHFLCAVAIDPTESVGVIHYAAGWDQAQK